MCWTSARAATDTEKNNDPREREDATKHGLHDLTSWSSNVEDRLRSARADGVAGAIEPVLGQEGKGDVEDVPGEGGRASDLIRR
jgi:hypothetical protein